MPRTNRIYSLATCGLTWLAGSCVLPGLLFAQQSNSAQVAAKPNLLGATPTPTDAAERLRSLPAEVKQELKNKQERFNRLSEAEQNRLRDLQQKVASSENPAHLEATATAYHTWLKTLTAAQQAELDVLPDDKKIERIRQIQDEQRKLKYRNYIGELVTSLPEADVKIIYNWLDKYFERRQKEFMEKAPAEFQKMASRNNDPAQQRRFLMTMLALRPTTDRFFKIPGIDAPSLPIGEFDLILPQLSAESKKIFEELREGSPERQEVTLAVIRAAIISKDLPPLNEEDLRKFFASLPTEEQERLQTLSAEAMRRELQLKFYFQVRNSGRQQFHPGEGHGRGGPGREGGPGRDGGPGREGPPGGRNKEGRGPGGEGPFRGKEPVFRPREGIGPGEPPPENGPPMNRPPLKDGPMGQRRPPLPGEPGRPAGPGQPLPEEKGN